MRVVVVGAGLAGVASAWYLARHGCAVTVLERGDAVACGTSHANAGMLTPSMADPWNAPGVLWHLLRWLGHEDAPFLVRLRALPSMVGWGVAFLAQSRPAAYRRNMEKNLRLACYSLEELRALRAELRLEFDQRENGTIKIFRTRAAFEAGVARNRLLAELGLEVRALDPAQVAEVEPSLAPIQERLAGGVYCPTDESGDACTFAGALADRARSAGVAFRFSADVEGFDRVADRFVAVHAGGERYPADAVLIAAGAWSPALLRPLGVALPVRPVKGYSVTLPVAGWNGAPRMPVIDDHLHCAVTPLGGRLRVAGTAEIAGFDRAPTPSRVANLFDLLLALYPSFEPHLDRANASPWAGLRPVSTDGVPRIGRVVDNLYVNTGHGHLGWTLAAGSARLVADIICGKPPALDAASYAPLRRE